MLQDDIPREAPLLYFSTNINCYIGQNRLHMFDIDISIMC